MDSRVAKRLFFRSSLCFIPAALLLFLPAAAKPDEPQLVPWAIPQDDALQRGLNALKENRLDQALEALTSAERDHPNDPRVRNFRGIVLLQLGKVEEAAAEYREAMRLDPGYEDAYRNLGFLLWTQHRLDEARDQLVRAVALSPGDSFAHYYLGRAQLDAQEYENAIRELKLSQLPFPDDPPFLLQLAQGCVAVGDSEGARKILRQASTLSLSGPQAAQAASLFLAARDYEPAIALLKTESKRQPNADTLWTQFDLGLTYLVSGSFEKAVEQSRSYVEWQQKKKAKPRDAAAAWSLFGISEARSGHTDSAINALHQAAGLEPANEEHWLNLTRELMEASRHADAVAAAQEGITANPNSYALHLRLGAAQLAAGEYKEAESTFRTLVDAGDPLPTSYLGLAQVLLREGRAEDAVSVLNAAEQKVGKNFLLIYFLGLSQDRAGKRTEASNAFREAVRLNPMSSEAHLGLGKTELASGKVQEAIAELQEALSLAPGNVQARRLLSQAYRRVGDTKRAEEFATTSDEKPAAPEGDLLGDFLLPKWQMPREDETR